MTSEKQSDAESWKYAEKALNWYGWGSPVGLGLFVVSLGIAAMSIGGLVLLLHQAGLMR
ncbi:MAG TPA: hypothetical protein VG985_03225 [Xanthobacteraceae bacterium]|nr:hypothetical protein [Xanthobacteraceae bacterium]